MNKTTPTEASVDSCIAAIASERRRTDAATLLAWMRESTGLEPRMWGSIVGLGSYRYRYASGREGETMLVGFAARSSNLAVYGVDLDGSRPLLERLGPHTTGKGCLYLKRLDDVDEVAFKTLIANSVAATLAAHEPATGRGA